MTDEKEVPEDFIDGQPDISKVFEIHEQAQYALDKLDPETRKEHEQAYNERTS